MSEKTEKIIKVLAWVIGTVIAVVTALAGIQQAGWIDIFGNTSVTSINEAGNPTIESTPTSEPVLTPVLTPTPEPTPTVEPTLTDTPLFALDNIASAPRIRFSDNTITDNYGNEYRGSYHGSRNLASETPTYTALLDGKFSRFQAVYYIPNGQISDKTARLVIYLDENEVVYETLEKTSRPIIIDECVAGGNVFSLEIRGLSTLMSAGLESRISDAVFIP
jgi:hypothetical protein